MMSLVSAPLMNMLSELLSILFPVAGMLLIVAGGLMLLARAAHAMGDQHEKGEGEVGAISLYEMKKMSPKTFREFTELALKIHRQRIERGIDRRVKED